jgi:uncharacterized linocin/CFP29 family protein
MLSRHPLEIPAGRKLSREEIADALRLSIIAELDAINLYTQLARAIDDEGVRRVLFDVAREEKTHVGEFLALLKKIDPEQVKELGAGEEEVRELTGGDPPSTPQEARGAPGDPAGLVARRVRDVVEESRRLRGIVKPVKAPGLEGVLGEAPSGGRSLLEGVYEISESFSLPSRMLRYWASTGIEPPMPQLYEAARKIASREDTLIVETLTSRASLSLSAGDWSTPGTAVEDVAKAVAELGAGAIPRPYVLLLHPRRYAHLIRYTERAGVMELHRVKALVDEVTPVPYVPEDQVIVFSANPSVVDILVASDVEVTPIGETREGEYEFRVWELILPRVKDPRGVVVLS